MTPRRSLRVLAVLARRLAKLFDDLPGGDDAGQAEADVALGEDAGAPRRLLEPGTLPGGNGAGPPAIWAERVRRGAPWLLEELSRGRARPGAALAADSATRLHWPAPSIGMPRWPTTHGVGVRMESVNRHVYDDRAERIRADELPRPPFPGEPPHDDKTDGVGSDEQDAAVRARVDHAPHATDQDLALAEQRRQLPFDQWCERRSPARETRPEAPTFDRARSRPLEFARERAEHAASKRDENAAWSHGAERAGAGNEFTMRWPPTGPGQQSVNNGDVWARDASLRGDFPGIERRAAYTPSTHEMSPLAYPPHRAELGDGQRPEVIPSARPVNVRQLAHEREYAADRTSPSRNPPTVRAPIPEEAHPWPELPSSPPQRDDGALSSALREAEHWRRITREQAGDPWSA